GRRVRLSCERGSRRAARYRGARRAVATADARRYHCAERAHFPGANKFAPTWMEGRMRIGGRLLLMVGLGLAAAFAAVVAVAQTYPSKPVRLIVTYPPAGSSDLMARILAEKLAEAWGQPVIVENKAGAAGSIGMDYAKQQAPDGQSFVIANLG